MVAPSLGDRLRHIVDAAADIEKLLAEKNEAQFIAKHDLRPLIEFVRRL